MTLKIKYTQKGSSLLHHRGVGEFFNLQTDRKNLFLPH